MHEIPVTPPAAVNAAIQAAREAERVRPMTEADAECRDLDHAYQR